MDRETKFIVQPFDLRWGVTQKEGDVMNRGKRRKDRQDLQIQQRWTEKWSLLTDSLICCSILVSSRVTRPCSFFFSLMSSSMRSRLRPSFSICPFFLVSSSATSSISRSLWNRRKSCRRSCCSAYHHTMQTIVTGGKHHHSVHSPISNKQSGTFVVGINFCQTNGGLVALCQTICIPKIMWNNQFNWSWHPCTQISHFILSLQWFTKLAWLMTAWHPCTQISHFILSLQWFTKLAWLMTALSHSFMDCWPLVFYASLLQMISWWHMCVFVQ